MSLSLLTIIITGARVYTWRPLKSILFPKSNMNDISSRSVALWRKGVNMGSLAQLFMTWELKNFILEDIESETLDDFKKKTGGK